jgi:hypothetical protein
LRFKNILYIVLFIIPSFCTAQDIIGVSSVWSDSFREWSFLTPDEDRSGRLYMRWPSRDDWSQWDFRLRDTTAEFVLKWKDDPNLWEVRCLGTTVTARTMWTGDFSQWRLSDGTHSIVWKSKYGNVRDEWIVRSEEQGFFSVYAYWQGDPREWVVYDELNEEVSYAMRLTMIFLTLIHSTPRI